MATNTSASVNNMIDLYRNAHGRKGTNIDTMAWEYYVEYTIYAEILKSFGGRDVLTEKEIQEKVRSNIDKSFDRCVSVLQYYSYMLKLCMFGCLERIEDDEFILFKITERGQDALRQQTFASMALAALSNVMAAVSNDTTIELNKRIKSLTIIMAVITGLGVLIAATQLILQILWR